MSLHIKFRCGLGSPNRQQMESGLTFVLFFLEQLNHTLKDKQTMFPKTDAKILPSSSANGRGDTSPQIQVINPNTGRFVLISKKFKT